MHDLRYAIRVLVKNLGFTSIAVLTLALGIGATAAMFSVVKAVLLEPLPYEDVERLAIISERDIKHNQVQPYTVSYLNFEDWREAQHSFSDLALFRTAGIYRTVGRDARLSSFRMVSANFFSLLGARSIIGRTFAPEDDRPGATPTVILSYTGWFHLSGPALGEKLKFDGKTYTIIGVLAQDFTFYTSDSNQNPDGYIPIGLSTDLWRTLRVRRPGLSALGKLKPGVSMKAASTELDSIAQRLATLYPDANENRGAAAGPILETMVSDDLRTTLYLLSIAVALIFVISCANVTNLILARAAARQKEITIRLALGGRWQVVRQLLVENLLLAIAGGIGGLAVGVIGIDLLVVSAPVGLPRISGIGMDWRVMSFALAVSLGSAVAFGAIPILHVLRAHVLTELKEGGSSSSIYSRQKTQNMIVAGELALAITLLVGAGLMLRSTYKALNGSPGFDARDMWSFSVLISPPDYSSSAERRQLFKELETRFAGMPQVWGASIAIGGLPKPVAVNPDYLKLMGIRLLKGRFFEEHDKQQSPPVIVIDEMLARARFRDEDPIGKPFSIDLPGAKALALDRPREIIGVVSHMQRLSLETDDETVIQSQFYLATEQLPDELIEAIAPRLTIKAGWPEQKLQGRIEATVHTINPNLEISAPVKMQDAVERALLPRRYVTKLFGAFASVAFVLAGMGTFGLISHSVSQRTQEIGIRTSLGAEPYHIVRMVLLHAAVVAAAGISLGLLASFWLKRFVEYLLYNVTATDLTTYGVAVLVLFGIAMAAAYIPALRVSSLEPADALRGLAREVSERRLHKSSHGSTSAQGTESCIEVFNLQKVYKTERGKTAPALDGVSFRIEPGTIFGLIGQNGAGKTTLVKILMGLAHPTAGSARLLGCLPGDPIAKRRIGYLPEQMKIPDHFYADDFLRYMGRLNAVDSSVLESRIPRLLEEVGLAGVRKPVKSFSKGMQQRLGLAQALLNDPELLFLDEPTDGLDPLGRVFVRDLLVRLRSAGKTVFLNSHLLSEIELVCDRILILHKGVVACEAKPSEFTSGTGDYIIRVAFVPEPMKQRAVEALQHISPSASWQDSCVRLRPRDHDQLNEVLDALRAFRTPIVSVEPVRLSLEQFFIQVIGEKES